MNTIEKITKELWDAVEGDAFGRVGETEVTAAVRATLTPENIAALAREQMDEGERFHYDEFIVGRDHVDKCFAIDAEKHGNATPPAWARADSFLRLLTQDGE